jgi:hypothetical protein
MPEQGVKIISTDRGVIRSTVELGRDSQVRRYRRPLWRPWSKKFQCRCCEKFTLDDVDYCDVCPECGWEDWYECHDSPGQVIRPNYLSLDQARDLVLRFGVAASSEANRAGGLSIEEIERASPVERAKFRTARERVEGR